ncbi:MAG TPA: HemK/PrmC family methyltransferase [Candidatus Limnocylindria bacterium]
MTRIGDALADATGVLRASGSPTPRLDAEVLLAFHLDRDRAWLLARPEEPLADATAFDELVARRAAGEPVAYIRGFKDWHSIRIRTDPRALIPRPETELLADAAIVEIESRLQGGAGISAWEVATGSGAVAIAIALHLGDAIESGGLTLVASDISAEALELAAENADDHGARSRIRLTEADLLPADVLPRPDVVIANLPYVSSAEVDERRGSLGFEPRVALDGGPDGLDLLRRLLADAPARAAAGATILLEIGVGQVEALRAIAPPGASVTVVPDLAGLDRVVRIDLPTLKP